MKIIKLMTFLLLAAMSLQIGATNAQAATLTVLSETSDELAPYFVQINGAGVGEYLPDGNYFAWCAEPGPEIPLSQEYATTLYSTIEGTGLPLWVDANGKAINYIINNKARFASEGAEALDIQLAIWFFIVNDESVLFTDKAKAIADEAEVQDFVPGPGQLYGVFATIANTGDGVQDLLIEVRLPQENPDVKMAAIGNFVWHDVNANGIQDNNELGIGGVEVSLYTNGNVLVSSMVTDPDGYYLFGDLVPGTYTVVFVTPYGYLPSPADHGDNDELDSDAINGQTGSYTLAPDEKNLTVDAGFHKCLPKIELHKEVVAFNQSMATYRYVVYNSSCIPITNMELTDDAGTPDYAGDDVQITALFDLQPGEARQFEATLFLPVQLCAKVGEQSTPAGTLITEDLGDTLRVTFIQNTNRNDNTYGANSSGWKPNRPHRFKDLVNSDFAEFRFTDGSGKEVLKFRLDYLSLVCGSYSSLGPKGGDGAIITGDRNAVLSWTTSLAENLVKYPGNTVDSSLEPDWENRMIYQVTITKQPFVKNGFGMVSISDQHNSPAKTGCESVEPEPCGTCVTNIATVTGIAEGQTLTATATAQTCSTEPVAGIGDYVWNDANRNGIQDSTESGISGVTVLLLNCDKQVLATTQTDSKGFYSFVDLAPGRYAIQVKTPSGYSFTTPGQGGDGQKDSDADPNSGVMQCTELQAGEYDTSWDAGLFKPCKPPTDPNPPCHGGHNKHCHKHGSKHCCQKQCNDVFWKWDQDKCWSLSDLFKAWGCGSNRH